MHRQVCIYLIIISSIIQQKIISIKKNPAGPKIQKAASWWTNCDFSQTKLFFTFLLFITMFHYTIYLGHGYPGYVTAWSNNSHILDMQTLIYI